MLLVLHIYKGAAVEARIKTPVKHVRVNAAGAAAAVRSVHATK